MRQEILAEDLGFVAGLLIGALGIFGLEVERGNFQRSGEARQAVLRRIRAHRLLPSPKTLNERPGLWLCFSWTGKVG